MDRRIPAAHLPTSCQRCPIQPMPAAHGARSFAGSLMCHTSATIPAAEPANSQAAAVKATTYPNASPLVHCLHPIRPNVEPTAPAAMMTTCGAKAFAKVTPMKTPRICAMTTAGSALFTCVASTATAPCTRQAQRREARGCPLACCTGLRQPASRTDGKATRGCTSLSRAT